MLTISLYRKCDGVIKIDKRTRKPRIVLYTDKKTGQIKGDAVITYDDPPAAKCAVDNFNGNEFLGGKIDVQFAYDGKKKYEGGGGDRGGRGGRGGFDRSQHSMPPSFPSEHGNDGFDFNSGDRGGFGSRGGGGMGRGSRGGKPEMASGSEWICPNESCGTNNFARRDVCYKCKTPRPPSSDAVGNAGFGGRGFDNSGGRGRPPFDSSSGRGGFDGGRGGGRGGGAGRGGNRANDWPCISCGNNNFSWRTA